MGDLRSKRLIVLKGVLFAGIVVASAAAILLAQPTWRVAALLVLLAWASARFYYFLFYVLEKYVDPGLRYAGVWALVKEIVRRRRAPAFRSADELFEATRGLIAAFEREGKTRAAAELQGGMASLNGLTDGWAQFLASIERVRDDRSLGPSPEAAKVLATIRSDVHRIVSRR